MTKFNHLWIWLRLKFHWVEKRKARFRWSGSRGSKFQSRRKDDFSDDPISVLLYIRGDFEGGEPPLELCRHWPGHLSTGVNVKPDLRDEGPLATKTRASEQSRCNSAWNHIPVESRNISKRRDRFFYFFALFLYLFFSTPLFSFFHFLLFNFLLIGYG